MLLTSKFSKQNIQKYFLLFFLTFFLVAIFVFITNIYFATNLSPISNFESGIYDKPFQISLYNPIPHSEIRYTLDNLKPSANSQIFTNPIDVSDSLIIRAQSFRNGEPIGLERIYSYIFLNRSQNLPILNLVMDDKDLFDSKTGIYSNFNRDWYRPAQISFYKLGGSSPEFNLSGKARIYGGKSRIFPRKSFHICFDSKNLNYKIFDKSDITNYDCLIIRNSGNDFNHTFIRDSLIHNFVSENTNLFYQDSKHVILYLNNMYYGIYDIRETKNNNSLSLKYGGSQNDYAVFYQIGLLKDPFGKLVKDSGTKDDLKKFRELQELILLDTNFEQISSKIEELLDLDYYFEYQIIQTYFNNFDYITHNFKMFRYNGIIKTPGTFQDGKFRWILYDTDIGLGFTTREYDIFYINLGNTDKKRDNTWRYEFFRNITKDYNYKKRFVNRYADYLNSKLLPENVLPYIDKYAKLVEPEVPFHIERWKNFILDIEDKEEYKIPLKSNEEWSDNIKEMREFVKNRRMDVFRDLNNNFSLGGFYTLNIQNPSPEMGYVKVNSLDIKSNNWQGIYFNKIEVDYKPVPYDGYEFVSWQTNTKELKIPVFRKQ